MNRWLLLIGLLAEIALVVGQLLLKVAMNANPRKPVARRRRITFFVVSIAAQSLYFFLWLGLLQTNDLSRVYPFDAVPAVLIVLCAILFLHERINARAWLAISLIFAGIFIISSS